MDRNSIQYSMGVFDEIESAIKDIGMVLSRSELSQTKGIPTGVIGFPNGERGWQIICNVVPTHVNEVSTTFIQLYQRLTSPAPEKRVELEQFIQGCNGQFILGCLLLFDDCVCMKYILALEPGKELGREHFQATLFAFCRQAENFIRRAKAICDGSMTVEQALSGSAIQ